MVALILFMIATVVALVLFDRYVEEHTNQQQNSQSSYVDEPRAERAYSSCSLFTVLGFTREEVRSFTAFRDHFRSYAEVTAAMRRAGLERVRLIVGIDFSASNEWQGRRTFKGELLHALKGTAVFNPYQKVLHTLAPAFTPFLHGQPIHAYGFGDVRTKDYDVFPLRPSGSTCPDMNDVLDAYNHSARRVQRSGPSSLAPLIRRATDLVQRTQCFHILLVLTDGQMRPEDAHSRHALVQASRCALSIVTVGVGDGPFSALEEWDEGVTDRVFDNFHFVDYHKVARSARNAEAALSLHALMEIPDQYQTIIRLGYLEKF
ncbi:copine family protein 1-like [Uloborus diversus]|uniref:copine family protein 1-like n=1 Tax=Uloborus diversus TaxID=327109 RepID=UPI002409B39B|nr:copine family protein 1-like [Uloborus diversus]